MADGSFPRPQRPFATRSPDPPQRSDNRAQGDPLQELARLIGQSDPFGSGRSGGSGREPARPAYREPPQPDHQRSRRDHDEVGYPRHGNEARYADDARHPANRGYEDRPRGSADGRYGDEPHFADRRQYESDHTQHEDEPRYADGHSHTQEGRHPDDDAGYYGHAHDAHESQYAGEGPEADYAGAHGYADDSGYAEDDYEGDAEYDGEDTRRDFATILNRKGARTALAVLGFAILGTAAAFGYRSLAKPGASITPPVIHAASAPDKIFPADNGSKAINERLNDGSAERLVRRDEDPVDIARGGSTGAVVAGTGGPFPAVTSYPTAPAAPSSVAATEPKRVRTVTIRSDQGMAAAAGRGGGSRAAPASAPSSAPLAIAPQSTQAVATAETAAPPPRSSASRASDASGGYVVQVSAQKTEAEAQASFRAMQAKYPVLGAQQPLIRRKDQGDKGVFYAAQVGPFGSRDEAAQFCESLKSSGGSCFVLRN